MAVTLQVCDNKLKDNRQDAEQNLSSGTHPVCSSLTNQGILHSKHQLSVAGASFIFGILPELIIYVKFLLKAKNKVLMFPSEMLVLSPPSTFVQPLENESL